MTRCEDVAKSLLAHAGIPIKGVRFVQYTWRVNEVPTLTVERFVYEDKQLVFVDGLLQEECLEYEWRRVGS